MSLGPPGAVCNRTWYVYSTLVFWSLHSLEDSRTVNIHHTRYSADPNITMQDLVDSYMAPFQACVEKGKVSSLMCSYNSVNGVPSCANKWLLDTVARKAWGFDGYEEERSLGEPVTHLSVCFSQSRERFLRVTCIKMG